MQLCCAVRRVMPSCGFPALSHTACGPRVVCGVTQPGDPASANIRPSALRQAPALQRFIGGRADFWRSPVQFIPSTAALGCVCGKGRLVPAVAWHGSRQGLSRRFLPGGFSRITQHDTFGPDCVPDEHDSKTET